MIVMNEAENPPLTKVLFFLLQLADWEVQIHQSNFICVILRKKLFIFYCLILMPQLDCKHSQEP